ncbi:phosphatase PAP2 family protein [Coprothermobacteraceae bacterium]|nr:phosphatase PAP2 family protein [Coprothermobacteraceae bacterium]
MVKPSKAWLARFVSDVGNPMLWGNFILVLIMLQRATPLKVALYSFAVLFVTVGLLTGIAFVVARNRQLMPHRDLIEREIRYLPYIVSVIAYAIATFYLYYQSWAPRWLIYVTSTMAVGVIVCGIINSQWKVSFHTFGASSMACIYYVLTGSPWAVLLLATSLIIGWSRTVLGVHTWGQVFGGFILGVAIPLLTRWTALGGFVWT